MRRSGTSLHDIESAAELGRSAFVFQAVICLSDYLLYVDLVVFAKSSQEREGYQLKEHRHFECLSFLFMRMIYHTQL